MPERLPPNGQIKATLIVNPAAGEKHTFFPRRKTREEKQMAKANRAANRLHNKYGWTVDIKETERPGHATVLTKEAIAHGAEVIIALGGDGTTNEVVNGLVKDITDEPGQTKTADDMSLAPALAILPSGTVNVLGKEIHVPKSIRRAASKIANSTPHTIDTATINGRRILLMGEVGVTAESFRRMQEPDQPKTKSGKRAYVKEIINVIRENKPSTRVTVTIDGGEPFEVNLLQALFQNTRGYLNFSRGDALADDGKLDVTIGYGSSAKKFLGPWIHWFLRPGRDHSKEGKDNGTRFYRGEHIIFQAVDGEQALFAHADAEVLHKSDVVDVRVNRDSLNVRIPNKGRKTKFLSKNLSR